ncbi:MAG: pyruvate kinase [Candidatus Bipolaricaulota bacterium]|nr:pyruvate kinase [Candidatus Bipolaricaulota bacterium]
MKRTKIVATLGPSSAQADVLGAMVAAGVDVVRVNSSYGDHEDHAGLAALARGAARAAGREIALLLDTRGPKVRVGNLPEPVPLRIDEEVLLGEGGIPVVPPGALEGLPPGTRILLADGALELLVHREAGAGLRCRVVRGGVLHGGKGVNVPGAVLPLSALTPFDRESLARAGEMGFDFVALSFVQRPEDVAEARGILGRDAQVVVKVERAEAVRRMEELVALADGAMVARGDLGVEVDLYQVPLVQKRLVDLANSRAKPVVVATQMLRSMVEAPVPTRAEVADVANAVWDGADALMLSEETAVGRYPVEAVRAMVQAARAAEEGEIPIRIPGLAPDLVGEVSAAVASAACRIAAEVGARAIVCATVSGWTARLVAAHRPRIPVVASTPHPAVGRRLGLVWGVLPLVIPPVGDVEALLRASLEAARKAGVVGPGERVVFTAGLPFGEMGRTNLVRVLAV